MLHLRNTKSLKLGYKKSILWCRDITVTLILSVVSLSELCTHSLDWAVVSRCRERTKVMVYAVYAGSAAD